MRRYQEYNGNVAPSCVKDIKRRSIPRYRNRKNNLENTLNIMAIIVYHKQSFSCSAFHADISLNCDALVYVLTTANILSPISCGPPIPQHPSEVDSVEIAG